MKISSLNIKLTKQMFAEEGRIEYIDVFRSMGIILMIMGHIGFGKNFNHFIFAFHMPMFFFISGMFFQVTQEKEFVCFIRKKVKTLLCPYAVFGCLGYGVWLIRHSGIGPLKHLLFENTSGLPIVGALWFLTALFWSEIIYFVIRHFVKKTEVQNLIIILISVFGCRATLILPFRLPYAMDVGFVGLGLLHIGYLFKNGMNKKYIAGLFSLRKYVWIILCIITVVLIFFNGPIDMRQGKYSIILLFWLNAILAIIVGIKLSDELVQHASEKLILFLTYIGRNSIVYVCLNQLAIGCSKVILYFLMGVHEIRKMSDKILLLVVTMTVLHICAYIFTTTKLKIFIGRSLT